MEAKIKEIINKILDWLDKLLERGEYQPQPEIQAPTL